MKTARGWHSSIKDFLTISSSRQRPNMKRPHWVIMIICLVTIFLIAVYLYPPRNSRACYIFSSSGCSVFDHLPTVPSRELTDEETAAQVVIREILKTPSTQSKNPKIAFMFLTPGSLPFEKLWDQFFHIATSCNEIPRALINQLFKILPARSFLFLEPGMPYFLRTRVPLSSFTHITWDFLDFKLYSGGDWRYGKQILHDSILQSSDLKQALFTEFDAYFRQACQWPTIRQYGHEDRFTVYVHASREKTVHVSRHFAGRNIRSEKVVWGKISMVDAERRLLAHALQDRDNQHFVLLSDSCIPLHNFDYVYNYLIFTNVSFLDCFEDPGPHGGGRYSEHMLPEVEYRDFRKGSQWFTMKRQHAILVMADSLYYTKFRLYCRPGMNGRNCYADEHYLPTLFQMVDPNGIANWSVTHVDWSEGKWHPKSYMAQDVTFDLLKNITSIDYSLHVTSDEKKTVMTKPCLWNGMRRPCYLFARKFYPETLNNLMHIFSNYTAF